MENEEAGLVVRADDKNHYDLLITERNGQRVVMLRKTLKDKVVDTTYKELPATGEVILMQPNAHWFFSPASAETGRRPVFSTPAPPAKKEAILSQLDKVEHMDAFVRHLPSAPCNPARCSMP